MRTFVFCETAAHVRYALKRGFANPVAVMPEAVWCLKKHRADFSTLESFYSEDELCNLAESNLSGQVAWRDKVDDWLQSQVSRWYEWDFRPARLTMYYLKIFFDEFILRTHILRRFVEQSEPDEIVFFESRAPSLGNWQLFPTESVYSLILPVAGPRFGVRAEPIKARRNSIPSGGWTPTHGWRTVVGPIWSRLPRTIQTFLLRPASDNRVVSRTEPVICLGSGYDLDAVRSEAGWRKTRYIPWSSLVNLAAERARNSQSPELNGVWESLTAQSFFWEACRVDDMEFT